MKTYSKLKIYLITAVSCFLLFAVITVPMTMIKAYNYHAEMEFEFEGQNSSALSALTDLSKKYDSYDDYSKPEMMVYVNKGMGTGNSSKNFETYSTILLFDGKGNLISRSGNLIYIYLESEAIMIPLDVYCTEEQSESIFNDVYNNSIRSHAFLIDVVGYYDNWGFVPQKLTFYIENNSGILLELEFDNTSVEETQIISIDKCPAALWVSGKSLNGNKTRLYTKKEKEYIAKSEELALHGSDTTFTDEFTKEYFGKGGFTNYPKFEYWSSSTVEIDGEEFILLAGAVGFPIRSAISHYMPLYIILFVIMIFMVLSISQSNIKINKLKFELEQQNIKK